MKKIFTFGLIVAIYSIGIKSATVTITNEGDTFVSDSITAHTGDVINFDINYYHNAVQVSKETWDANGNTPLAGGFNVPYDGGTIKLDTAGIYYYVCTPHAHLGMKGVIVVLQSNSIKDIAVKQIPDLIVYPNPASEFIKVEFNAPQSEKVTLDLIDMTGRDVDKLFYGQVQGSFANTFSLPALSNGKYFLRFNYGNETVVKPVIIKK